MHEEGKGGETEKNGGESFFKEEGQANLRISVVCYQKKRSYRKESLVYRKI
jgi:hypothetical protein